MKIIIAEKPSVAKAIADFFKLKDTKKGYFEDNEYQVTWAIGHLGGLADPEFYNEKYKIWNKEDLPLIPEKFSYVVKENTKKQFSIIKSLFNSPTCKEIICATDSGREGEHIFRIIYFLSGSKVPFKRLWISSLTKNSFEKGFSDLKNGTDYNNLAYAAQARERFDWLVGLNCTRALTISQESTKPLSIGRVQTPTLYLIVKNYLANLNFKSEDYYIPSLTLIKDNIKFKAKYIVQDNILDKNIANSILSNLAFSVKCTEVKLSTKSEKPPLLFDLNTLQGDCNSIFHLTAAETLEIGQFLYENQYISYPRTDSKYLSEDVFLEVPEIIAKINSSENSSLITKILSKAIPKNSVDDSKITDHHAIIPTGVIPHSLSEKHQNVYDLIRNRFLSNFSEECIKNITTYIFNDIYKATGTIIISKGWREIYIQEEETEDKEETQKLPSIIEQEIVEIKSKEILSLKTTAPKLFTEKTLLLAMDNIGRNSESEFRKNLSKGLGTPATRSGIIETLKKRVFIISEKNKIKPTPLGLQLIELIKDLKICSPELTAKMEYDLSLIENGKLNPSVFFEEAKVYTKKVTEEILMLKKINDINSNFEKIIGKCPICSHDVIEKKFSFDCKGENCNLKINKEIGHKIISTTQITKLLKFGKSDLIKDFKSKEGKEFNAFLTLTKQDEKISVKFEFETNKTKK